MNGAVLKIEAEEEKARIAREVLLDLPEWFGLPESTENYITESSALPFWAFILSGEAVGFIALNATSPYTADLFVMGVKKAHHRKGIGSALFSAFRNYAKAQRYEYLQVKTVDAGHYKQYDETRLFYEKLGFRALEVFPDLWDPHNPCLILIRSV